MNILHQVKQAGGSASLTFTTTGGKFKAKLEVQLGAPSSTSSGLSPSLHYGKVSMGGATFRILNFASHFIRVQIFQIDFPLIISASKYFRQISLSFYICRGQNEQPAIPEIYLLGDEMNSCLKEGMESESEIINQIFGHHAASKKER